jgi:hypothetical protein
MTSLTGLLRCGTEVNNTAAELSPAPVIPDPHRLVHAAKFAGYPRVAEARSPMHGPLQPVGSCRPECIPDA